MIEDELGEITDELKEYKKQLDGAEKRFRGYHPDGKSLSHRTKLGNTFRGIRVPNLS
jgi:hypothetical protein